MHNRAINPHGGTDRYSTGFGEGIIATVLSPSPALTGIEKLNNHSSVLHLEFGQISFLLPGDIEAPVGRRLVQANIPLTATVLKSPYHGSKTSSSDAFLAAIDLQIVVVPVGEDNHFGHPAPQVLERYAEHGSSVLRTDRHGTIEFVTDGQQLWVEMAQ